MAVPPGDPDGERAAVGRVIEGRAVIGARLGVDLRSGRGGDVRGGEVAKEAVVDSNARVLS